MKVCPHCAEIIQDEAARCEFCQREVVPIVEPPENRLTAALHLMIAWMAKAKGWVQ